MFYGLDQNYKFEKKLICQVLFSKSVFKLHVIILLFSYLASTATLSVFLLLEQKIKGRLN